MTLFRPDWDEYFLGVAQAVSARSDCRRAQVGAVLVDRPSRRTLSTGYVGVASGEPGCLEGACPRGLKSYSEVPPYSDYSDCISTHAERNCINFAAQWYSGFYNPDNTVMYVTREPCNGCRNYCRVFGIIHFVWPGGSI